MKNKQKGPRGQKIRYGVIGVGGMGCGHCRSLATVKSAQLTAVCDTDPAAAEQASREFGVPGFTDHRALIQAGLCDAVSIATPHPAHAPIAIDCLNAGLPVLTEKPLCERVSMAEKMIEAARRNRVPLAVMFQRRFEPVIAAAAAYVRSGKLGRIYRTSMISPEFRSQGYYDSGTWRATWAGEGGGVMMNQSPHILDIFILLGGMPSEVYGRTETRMHRIEVEDQAEALLKYPDGGTGYLYCSTNEFGPAQMIEVFGDKGKLILRNGELKIYRFKPGIQQAIGRLKPAWSFPELVEVPVRLRERKTSHADGFANFTRHLLRGEPLVHDGATGLPSLELANAVTLSSHTGKWVKLPLSRPAYDRLLAKLQRGSKHVPPTQKRNSRATDPRL